MASSLTYQGEEYALIGDGASDGSIARLATAVRLYDSTSSPSKTGTEGVEFVEVANGNGYTTGGHAIVVGNWSYLSAPSRLVLADQVWTASGGSIANIAGAYVVDTSDNVLLWFERSSPVTLADGESITLDDLTVRFP